MTQAASGGFVGNKLFVAVAVIVVVAIALLAYNGLSGKLQPTPTPLPTATPTIAPTSTPTAAPSAEPPPTPSATATPQPTVAYASKSLSAFISECAGPALVTGLLRRIPVGNNSEQTVSNKFAVNDRQDYVPMEGFPPDDKPATLDATGATEYDFYGSAQPVANSSHPCWMAVERIAEKS